MFTLRGKKIEEKDSLSCSLFLSVNKPLRVVISEETMSVIDYV